MHELNGQLRLLRRELRWLRRTTLFLVVVNLLLLGSYLFARTTIRYWFET